MADVFAVDFVHARIDVDRMTKADAVVKRLCGTQEKGLPWFAVLDAAGEVIATSDGPEGNVGFPVMDKEIAHFIQVLRSTKTRLTDAQVDKVQKALQDSAKKLKADAGRG